MKNPLTPAGIEPATFRFVAQHLNHCATAVPSVIKVQEHVHLQVGTEIAFYEKCNDTGVTLSPSLQQPLALKSNGKPNLCNITKAVCNSISSGQQYIFCACQHIVEGSMTPVASFKEVSECLQAVK